MVDSVDPTRRSEIMGRVRNKDTKPEMIVRRITHGLGYRYRLHYGKLPGRPDLVFPSRRKVIFVHGCFWHRHKGCRRATIPKTRTDSWIEKFEKNVARDRRVLSQLKKQGWKVLVIWECQTFKADRLEKRVRSFLEMS